MKHDDLRSIAHNIADSLASGIGLLVGFYEMDVFGEAASSPEGHLTVDFLLGTAVDGRASPSLCEALLLYRNALSALCERHGVSVSAFRELTVKYYTAGIYGRRFIVTVEDQACRRSIDEYEGVPGRRVMGVDHLGRLRRKRGTRMSRTGKPLGEE
jgi:hypothetical protein